MGYEYRPPLPVRNFRAKLIIEGKMKIKIKKLHPDAVIPQYATPGSAGFDLVAVEDLEIHPGSTKLVKTGLSVEIQSGYEMQIRPRSGTSLKTSLRVANSPGTVDCDFRGEVCVIMTNIDVYQGINFKEKVVHIKKGERIAQGVICPVVQAEFEEVAELSDTQRGSGDLAVRAIVILCDIRIRDLHKENSIRQRATQIKDPKITDITTANTFLKPNRKISPGNCVIFFCNAKI